MRLLCAAVSLCFAGASAKRKRKGRGVVVAVTGHTQYVDEAATNMAPLQGGPDVSIVLPDDNAELASACAAHRITIGWHCIPVSRKRLVETLFVDSPRVGRASAGLAALSAAIAAGTVKERHAFKIRARVYHIAARLATPYKDTIFMDADVYPCLPLEKLWRVLDADVPGRGLLDVYDVMAAYESNSISRHKGIYHGSNIHDAAQKINRTWEQKHFNYKPTKTPRAWPEINSGVMVYRSNDRSKELVENWLANYIDDCRFVNFSLDITSGQDQPTFRTSLFDAVTTGMRFYPLPPIWNTRAWRPNLTGMDYYHKKPYEANCCFDGTVVAAGREHKDLPRKQVSIILDHKCVLPAAVADYEGGPRYINATAKREQYPKELPNH